MSVKELDHPRSQKIERHQFQLCLSKSLFIWVAVSLEAICSISDVPGIYKAFSDPSTNIISSVTNERCGATSCFGNGFSQESSKISNPRVEIAGDFVKLSIIEVRSPCSGILYSFSDEFISFFLEFNDKFFDVSLCFMLPIPDV